MKRAASVLLSRGVRHISPQLPENRALLALRHLASTSAASSSTATQSSPNVPPPSQKPLKPEQPSGWFRRGMYIATGVSAIGISAAYINDREQVKNAAYDIYDSIDSRIRFFTEPSREKLLPDQLLPYPGAPPLRTLVVDLDNTLVHSSYSRATGWRIAKRPGAEAFLAYMAQFYEIVVFTENMNTYADPILDKMDPNEYVAHRLYRAETNYKRGVHIKDLSHLNREMEKVIVIDHDERHVCMQPENGIMIPKWTGDADDTALLDLIPFLEGLVRVDVQDVREEVSVLKGKPLVDGIGEWQKLAAGRETPGRQTSLFGHGAANATPSAQPSAGEAVDEESGGKGRVWGTVFGSGLFGGGEDAVRT